MSKYVGILDYGIGNIRSVHNMLWKIGSKPLLVKYPEDLKRVNKLILPGVGSFDSAMVNLEKFGFKPKFLKAKFQSHLDILIQ